MLAFFGFLVVALMRSVLGDWNLTDLVQYQGLGWPEEYEGRVEVTEEELAWSRGLDSSRNSLWSSPYEIGSDLPAKSAKYWTFIPFNESNYNSSLSVYFKVENHWTVPLYLKHPFSDECNDTNASTFNISFNSESTINVSFNNCTAERFYSVKWVSSRLEDKRCRKYVWEYSAGYNDCANINADAISHPYSLCYGAKLNAPVDSAFVLKVTLHPTKFAPTCKGIGLLFMQSQAELLVPYGGRVEVTEE